MTEAAIPQPSASTTNLDLEVDMPRHLLAPESPAFIILDHQANISDKGNFATTAQSITSIGRPVEVSFSLAAPPFLSKFLVHFPGLDEGAPDSRIIRSREHQLIATHKGVALIELAVSNPVIGGERGVVSEHFVYCAASAGQRPGLFLIPSRRSFCIDLQMGYSTILSSDDGSHFHIVSIEPHISCIVKYQYNVSIFSSKKWAWTSYRVKLSSERYRNEVLRHIPSKAIILESGCVCWVDLSLGILLIDQLFVEPSMLDEASMPEIRYVPLPEMMPRNSMSLPAVMATQFRDICCHKDEIRFVEVEKQLTFGFWHYKVSFWTMKLGSDKWDVRLTDYIDLAKLYCSFEALNLNLDYILSMSVPRLSMEDNYVVYLISKDKGGVVIAYDITSKTAEVVARQFCNAEVSYDLLSCWQVFSPCFHPGCSSGPANGKKEQRKGKMKMHLELQRKTVAAKKLRLRQ